MLAAALVPGAVLLAAPAPAQAVCNSIGGADEFARAAAQAPLVVLARVEAVGDTSATLLPEAYFRGAATGQPIALIRPAHVAPCAYADLETGDRIIAIVPESQDLRWPGPEVVYHLRDGVAFHDSPPDRDSLAETALIDKVRAATGQYAVPAASDSEGASLDWKGAVLPVGGALLVVFAISLALMRLWHRIDPS